MSQKSVRALAVLMAGLVPAVVAAQVVESGSRAKGMAAFVAVADDPSAVWWNPAGLGGAVVVGAVVEWGDGSDVPEGDPRTAPAGVATARQRVRQVSLALPQLGLSYGERRLASGRATGTAVLTGDSRDLMGGGVAFGSPGDPMRLTHLETRHLGLTLTQSLFPGVVAGATGRLVRGGFTSGAGAAGERWPRVLDEAEALRADAETRLDLDAGVMATAGRFRLGVVAQHLRAPQWRGPAGEVGGFERRIRAGAAWGAGWPGLSPVVVALDTDLSTAETVSGERRDVAAGVEGWLRGRRVGLRGGLRVSTVGDSRPVGSLGVSLGLTAKTYLDAHVARGRDRADRTWSVAGRFAY